MLLEVFNVLDKEFSFGVDVCVEDEIVKCLVYWIIEDDVLI